MNDETKDLITTKGLPLKSQGRTLNRSAVGQTSRSAVGLQTRLREAS